MNSTEMIWAMLFGAVGVGFFVYGRRQHALVPLLAGLGLMAFPYFVSGTLATVAAGALLVAAGLFIRL